MKSKTVRGLGCKLPRGGIMRGFRCTALLMTTACLLFACEQQGPTSGSVSASDSAAQANMSSVDASQVSPPVGPPLSDAEIDREAQDFLQAILSDDDKNMLVFYPGDEISPIDAEFTHTKLRKIVKGQSIATRHWRQGREISIEFYQTQFKSRLDQKDYQQKSYLKTFFFCDFTDAPGRLVITNSFCYDETEGPYERESD